MDNTVKQIRNLLKFYESNFHVHVADSRGEKFYVVSPFLDSRNDAICYCVEACPDGQFVVHDNGAAMTDLEMSGCEVSQGKRKEILQRILARNSVSLDDNRRLSVQVKAEHLAKAQARLIKCMQDMTGLALLTRSNVAQVFSNDVEKWFKEQNVTYKTNVSVKGTGFSHEFDFLVQTRECNSYCQIIRHFDKSVAKSLALTSSDLQSMLQIESEAHRDSRLLALVDDRKTVLSDRKLELIERMGFIPVGFSSKDDLRQKLHLN